MKRIFYGLVVFFFLHSGCKSENEARTGLSSINLLTLQQEKLNLSFIKQYKAAVFIFLTPDCPLSQNYTLTLNNLQEQYSKDSIFFCGIIPGNSVAISDVEEFVSNYKIDFKVLIDRDLILTEYLSATKTPEVVVINAGGDVVYKGAIDDWAIDLGSHRNTVTQHFLADALNALNAHSLIKIKKTKPVGCFIERNRK